jgi:hypothetical protein
MIGSEKALAYYSYGQDGTNYNITTIIFLFNNLALTIVIALPSIKY